MIIETQKMFKHIIPFLPMEILRNYKAAVKMESY
jgi:hypothetical protein